MATDQSFWIYHRIDLLPIGRSKPAIDNDPFKRKEPTLLTCRRAKASGEKVGAIDDYFLPKNHAHMDRGSGGRG